MTKWFIYLKYFFFQERKKQAVTSRDEYTKTNVREMLTIKGCKIKQLQWQQQRDRDGGE